MMKIFYGDGVVTTNILGDFHIILRFKGKIFIPKLGKNIKLKMLKNKLTIFGKLDKIDSILFKYFGKFIPISVKDVLTNRIISISPTSLGYWVHDSVTWDSDSSLWESKEGTYVHKIKLRGR